MTPTQTREAAERARQRAKQAENSEYPRYGRAVYTELAQSLDNSATVHEQTEADASAEGLDYQTKRLRRVARLRRRAAVAKADSLQQSCESHQIAERRPFGQPILVGHHSERGHRADLRRQDAKDRKAHNLYTKAQHLEHAARAAETNRAISSDDEQAIEKLAEKLAVLEQQRGRYKAINAEFRKLKGDIDAMTTVSDRLKEGMKAQRDDWYMGADKWRPFDGYMFSNMGAEVRRLKGRIEELTARAETPEAAPVDGEGFSISEDAQWGRILVDFDHKPVKAVCRHMRGAGWKWAPSRCAWVRHLNANGKYAAEQLAEQLPALLTGGDA